MIDLLKGVQVFFNLATSQMQRIGYTTILFCLGPVFRKRLLKVGIYCTRSLFTSLSDNCTADKPPSFFLLIAVGFLTFEENLLKIKNLPNAVASRAAELMS